MTRVSRLLLVGLLAAVIAAGIWHLSGQPAPQPAASTAEAQVSLSVELVQPSTADWPQSLKASGPLVAWQESVISAEASGLQILKLHVDVGSRVKRGDLLIELNSASLRAEVQQAKAQVAVAQANLKQAIANVKRAHAARQSGALSAQQIEQYDISRQSAEASLAQAQAGLNSMQVKLAQTRITAIDDGIISARSASLGMVVNAGTELLRLIRDERIEWQAQIDARQLTQLQTGQSVELILPDDQRVTGKIRQLSPTLDANTRLATAYVALPVQAGIRAGLYLQGRVLLGQSPALSLPSSAVILRDGRHLVFEWDASQQQVLQRQVKIGRIQADRIEILQGLPAQASVVLQGGAFLNDGDRVRVVNRKEGA